MSRIVPALVAAIALSLAAPAHAAQSCSVERASVDSGGAEGNAGSLLPALSSDGRFVAFQSDASNLVAGDTNGCMDVFVRDRLTGTCSRCSVDSSGAQAGGSSRSASISGDGRFVAFESDAADLVAGDDNGATDVFVHDRLTGLTTLASRNALGQPGDGASRSPALSADGAWLAFASTASDLVAGDDNGQQDVFVRDLQNALTERVSRGANGEQGSAYSWDPSISADGRFVAFESAASEFVPGDTNGHADVFVFDRVAASIERASVSSSGAQASGRSRYPCLSADGRFVAFDSHAADLVGGDANGAWDSFVRDRLSGTTERVSVGSGGSEADDSSYHPSLSADARWIAFESAASNLVPGDANATLDIFVHDRLSGGTRRVSVKSDGSEADGPSGVPVISSDASIVALWSEANDLVPADTNGVRDVFVHTRGCRSGTPYCSGDGSGTACPCGNAGAAGAGCANSAGAGAVLAEHGSASVAEDDLAFAAHGLPPGQPGLLFAGLNVVSGGAGAAFGDGLRCAGGGVVRLGTMAAGAAGSAHFGPGLGAAGGWAAGDLRRFQVWYRDPLGPCASGFNLTNGVELGFGP